MISLSDSELQIVMTAAAPIRPRDRGAFLADVAAGLAKYEVLGPGIVARVVRDIQRQHLNPPSMRGTGGKWDH